MDNQGAKTTSPREEERNEVWEEEEVMKIEEEEEEMENLIREYQENARPSTETIKTLWRRRLEAR